MLLECSGWWSSAAAEPGKLRRRSAWAELTGLPVVELDQRFWSAGLQPMPAPDWVRLQREVTAPKRWILDGDLGPYDAPTVRLVQADTVLLFDFSSVGCAWRALRRSRERADFWWWLLTWRVRSRKALLQAIATFAPHTDLHIFPSPHAVERLLSDDGGGTEQETLVELGADIVAPPAKTPNGRRMIARHPDGAVFEYVGR